MFFPPELVALVLEELFSSSEDEFDRCKDLSSIALTCRSFHEQAEPLLYRRITFRLGTKRGLKIAQRLQSGRAAFVQELCIEIHKDPALPRRGNKPSTNELYTCYNKLPFNLMTNLRVLSVSHKQNGYGFFGLGRNPMQVDEDLDKILNESLPENVLHEFSHIFHHQRADLRFLSRQTELRCLTLHSTLQEPQSSILMNTLVTLPKIDRLELTTLDSAVLRTEPVFPSQPRMARFSLKLQDIHSIERNNPQFWGLGAAQFTILDLSSARHCSKHMRHIARLSDTTGIIEGIANEFLNLKLLRISWEFLSDVVDPSLKAWTSLSSLHRLEALEIYMRYPHADMFQRHHHRINSLLHNYTGRSLRSILVNCDKPPWPSYEMVRLEGMAWDQICPVDTQDWLVRYTERARLTTEET
ncbi:hypothetical protein SISSUDRAFT_1065518 [Sistotremastrum suecicum HHB10207 ss-3]|uniref:Uncharacterized protein n=1 Tax=Sistotremastrum suecicum HHB10207 ss-3 TaxID=1314776 RepID=A0A165ZDU8_9AGAM|nr:hypothetical protein SISSUDRAFT_1065518 [Sistotremastrum suecicum HHB10207 ss-3]